jgi:hypothetical protein
LILNIHTKKHRASSTWKHDTRKFGPLNAINNNTEDAWKSAQSEEGSDPLAYFEIDFHRPVRVNELRIQFQGGFVGMDCIVYQKCGNENNDDWEECEDLFLDPIDSNEVQTFASEEEEDDNAGGKCNAIRIEFGRSTDFYGRIVIYSLEVWGRESS